MRKYKYISVAIIMIILFNMFSAYAIEEKEKNNLNNVDLFKTIKNLSFEDKQFNYSNDILSTNPDIKNGLAISETSGKDFIYESKIKVNQNTSGEFSLVFRYTEKEDITDSYKYYKATVNFDTKKTYISRVDKNQTIMLTSEKDINELEFITENNETSVEKEIEFKVVVIDNHYSIYIGDDNVCNTYDYINTSQIYSDSKYISSGFVGVSSNLCDLDITNLKIKTIDNKNTPYLKDVELSSSRGDIERNSEFRSSQLIYQYYVSNDTNSLKLNAKPMNKNTKVTFLYESGKIIKDDIIALLNGQNIINVICENKGVFIKYKINVYKRSEKENYYYEDFRSQYHYSPKDGVITNIAGLVKVEDTYHNFYEYSIIQNEKEISMWSHTTSKDLIKWEEKPIAFYSNEQGEMLSSTIVYDKNNTSGLFKENTGGLISIISVNSTSKNNLICAYSEDNGYTWKNTSGSIMTYTDKENKELNSDILELSNPQIFRYEDKWFMVTSKENLTIYSSKDLLNWKYESTNENVNFSNASIFRTQVIEQEENSEVNSTKKSEDEIEYKWVVIGDNNSYKIGDFNNDNTSAQIYKFKIDEKYKTTIGKMNYGTDVDYSKIYYIDEYGEKNIDVVATSLMDCLAIDDELKVTKSNFIGNTSLMVDLKVLKNNNKFKLVQKPIKNYKNYYNDKKTFSFSGVVSDSDDNILKDLEYASYVIDAKITPKNSTITGFNLLMEDNKKTSINYYNVTKELIIDRSKSGELTENQSDFNKVISNIIREDINKDGSIDFKIYVDNSTIEIYMANNTKVYSYKVFPKENSKGMEFFTVGGDTKIDIKVTPINTIWDKVKKEIEEPTIKTTEKITEITTKQKSIFSDVHIIIIIIIILGTALGCLGIYAGFKSLKTNNIFEKKNKKR